MTDYRAVMTLLIKKRSYRQIEDQLARIARFPGRTKRCEALA